MIALYAFIITPSTFWHQHQENRLSSPTAFVSDHGSAAVAEDQDNYCQICSHHFSYYSKDAVDIEINRLTCPTQLLSVPAESICSIHLTRPAERGPPSLI